MAYPTKKEAEGASRIQLAYWHRFLPSPGTSAIGKNNFEQKLSEEAEILNLIEKRFKELGGMTPGISKLIGLGGN